MIKKLIIGMILLICITSGVFAAMSYYDSTNNTNVDSNSTIGDSNNTKPLENSLIILINNNNDFTDNDFQYSYGYVVNVNGELRHYITDRGAYYLESDGLTDRYLQCVECGGFVPVGDITNPLPEKYLCHCNAIDKLLDSYKKFTWSRDEAYNHCQWKESQGFYEHNYAIYCKDCGGYVFLDNCDDILTQKYQDVNDYLNIMNLGYSNVSSICSHYNGTLNIYDIYYNHPEDLHPGWFRSLDKYNFWLLHENPTSSIGNNSLEETVNDSIDACPEGNEGYPNSNDFDYQENNEKNQLTFDITHNSYNSDLPTGF